MKRCRCNGNICATSPAIWRASAISFPAFPTGYFDAETEHKLANYQKRASAERQIPLSVELPHLTLRSDLATGVAAAAIFGNWLEYLSDGVKLVGQSTITH